MKARRHHPWAPLRPPDLRITANRGCRARQREAGLACLEAPRETLLARTGLLSQARPEHIWTAQPHTHRIARIGELPVETLHRKGVLGCVLDGCWRHHLPIYSYGPVDCGLWFLAAEAAGQPLWRDIGITGTLKTARLAEAHHMNCELHTTIFHPLELVNLHLNGAIGNSSYFELLWPMQPFAFGLDAPLPIENGIARMPSGARARHRAGLGHDRKRNHSGVVTLTQTDPRLLLLHPDDNVLVLRAAIFADEEIQVSGEAVRVEATVGLGHKLARWPIAAGEKVLKYGAPIGSASRAIPLGAHVHLNNLKSDYTATHSLEGARSAHDAEAPDGTV